ncbi:hypothetical protein O181_006554 [Austropuccinia psidii MF-1]|uniref:Uncharacterized protein n=1 Tax=Austropuccinia psidii MF-1 TaxID=1389203 RepID=A0A9Q3GH01_9BASI|nr:hypothetical protein [Austropuccinia psidii MF-1]
MKVFSIGMMDFTQQDFQEMMTRKEGSHYTSSSPLTPYNEEEHFTPGDFLHDEYLNMGEISSDEYPIPLAVLESGPQKRFEVDPQFTTASSLIPDFQNG